MQIYIEQGGAFRAQLAAGVARGKTQFHGTQECTDTLQFREGRAIHTRFASGRGTTLLGFSWAAMQVAQTWVGDDA